MKRSILALVMVLSISACSDSDTLTINTPTPEPEPELELSSFNVTDITAINNKTIKLTWEVSQTTTNVNYDVCIKDETKVNSCELLGNVIDQDSYQHTFPTLYSIGDSAFFVIASKGESTAISPEAKVDAQETIALIDYIKDVPPVTGAFWGYRVALSDDSTVMAVSGYNSTTASVFRLNPSTGQYEFEAHLTESNIVTEDRFGWDLSMSADGQVVVIGAYKWDGVGDALYNSGGAFVYRYNGNWNLEATLVPSIIEANDYYGRAVSISGDASTILVGAVDEDSTSHTNGDKTLNDQAGVGAAYVWEFDGSNWIESAYLKPTYQDAIYFGLPVALNFDGSLAAISKEHDSNDAVGVNGIPASTTITDAGGVYLFKNNNGIWQNHAYIKPHNPHAHQKFGSALDFTANNTLLIGAENDNEQGAIFTFEPDQTGTWSQVDYLTPENGGPGYRFGFNIDADWSGQKLVVGSPWHRDTQSGITGDPNQPTLDPNSHVGAVDVYERHQHGWKHIGYLKAISPESSDHFGYDVAASNQAATIAASDPADDSSNDDPTINDSNDTGSVMIFH
ncbi:FG-GAP repeat protein [Vibrio sp. PNB22_3_1]